MQTNSKWTDTHRRNFKRFWAQDLGQESKQIIADLKQAELEAALMEPTPERVAERVHRAAGIDEVLQTLEALMIVKK